MTNLTSKTNVTTATNNKKPLTLSKLALHPSYLIDSNNRIKSQSLAKGCNIAHKTLMRMARQYSYGIELYGKVEYQEDLEKIGDGELRDCALIPVEVAFYLMGEMRVKGSIIAFVDYLRGLSTQLPTQKELVSPTMSSLEIAEVTGKLHRNVTRDIEVLLNQLDGDTLSPEHIDSHSNNLLSTYKDRGGRTRHCYQLPRDLTLTLITGYRADLRYKVIKRWQLLESSLNQ